MIKKLATLVLFLTLGTLGFAQLDQQCTVVQQAPIGVVAGQCTQLTANCSNPVWSLAAGSEGTVDANGKYCAPPTVYVQSYAAGAQELPNNADINATHNQLPTHAQSTTWLNRWLIASNQLNSRTPKLGAGPRFFQSNYFTQADESIPCQNWHAVFFVVDQDVCWPIVLPPFAEMQNAFDLSPYGAPANGTGPDRREQINQHLASGLSKQFEFYQLMPDSHNVTVQRGQVTTFSFSTNALKQQPPSALTLNINNVVNTCSTINGLNKVLTLISQVPATDGYVSRITASYNFDSRSCTDADFAHVFLAGSASNVAAANAGTMGEFDNFSNQSHRSTTAGGLPFGPTSVDKNQWYHNVKDHVVDPHCKDSHGNPVVVAGSHVLGFTLLNNQQSGDNLNSSTTGNQVLGGHPQFAVSCVNGNPTHCSVTGNMAAGGLDMCDSYLSIPASPNSCLASIRFMGVSGGNWVNLNDGSIHDVAFDATTSTTGSNSATFTIPVDSTNFGTGVWTNAKIKGNYPPYGTTWVLDTTKFNIDSYCTRTDLSTPCPYEKALLNELACYGEANDDGGVGTNTNGMLRVNTSGFEPKQLVDAAKDLATNADVATNLRVVNPTGTMPLNTPGANNGPNQLLTTNFRRTTVLVNGSNGVDINLVGTVVGIYPEKLPLIRPGRSFKPSIFVTGSINTGFTCGLESPVAGVSIDPDGTINASNVSVTTSYREKCVSTSDPTKVGYADGSLVPTAADGSWNLWWGLNPTFVDSHGTTWYGPSSTIQWAGTGSAYEDQQGALYAPRYGTYNSNASNWTGNPDGKLYGEGISARNDVAEYLACDQDADITIYGEAGLGISQAGTLYNLEINGNTVDSNIDSFVRAGGQYKGYTHTYHAPCANGTIWFIARYLTDSTKAVYGMSPWSALHVAWSGSTPTMTLSVAPSTLSIQQGNQSTVGLTVTIGGGFNNNVGLSASIVPGVNTTINPITIPAPGSGNAVGTIVVPASTPVGQYSVTFTADGHNIQSSKVVTVNVTTSIKPLKITTTSLPNGYYKLPYTAQLTAEGGVGTYKWAVAGILPPNLNFASSGLITGTPMVTGNFGLRVSVCDTETVPQCVSGIVTLQLLNNPVTITTTKLPDALVGQPYKGSVAATGGYPPYVFTLASGKLPTGLVLMPNGQIVGLAKVSPSINKYVITVKVTDNKGQTATSLPLTITVRVGGSITK